MPYNKLKNGLLLILLFCDGYKLPDGIVASENQLSQPKKCKNQSSGPLIFFFLLFFLHAQGKLL